MNDFGKIAITWSYHFLKARRTTGLCFGGLGLDIQRTRVLPPLRQRAKGLTASVLGGFVSTSFCSSNPTWTHWFGLWEGPGEAIHRRLTCFFKRSWVTKLLSTPDMLMSPYKRSWHERRLDNEQKPGTDFISPPGSHFLHGTLLAEFFAVRRLSGPFT